MSHHTTVPRSQTIADALARHWALPDAEVSPLMGGMNSVTWHVRHDNAAWVAKAVPEGPPAVQLRYGLELALRVEDAGIPSGAPVPARDGRRTVPVAGHELALLRWVPGRELDGHDEGDMLLMGATLARVHRALGSEPVSRDEAWSRFDLLAGIDDDAVLDARPWMRPAIEAVATRLRRLRPETLTWGPVHGDPAPEHFRFDPATGRCGLIDWGASSPWARVYDLATVVMDAGGPHRARPLIRAYTDRDALSPEETDRALDALLDYRYAINALYYAGRILHGDVTGVADQSGNEERLERARRWLVRPSR
ncbi:phosphotransferase enzyme family protein [Streptomyces sp. 6N223]|uniref:phosphotransferase enzyme family protein n=1 Tax=Streptomyces sp. 6N223 TaxID=3457412 RepID=UPI003FD62907